MIQKVKEWIAIAEQFEILLVIHGTIFEVRRLKDGFSFELSENCAKDCLYNDSVICINEFHGDLIHVDIAYTVEHPVTKIVSVCEKKIAINDIIISENFYLK